MSKPTIILVPGAWHVPEHYESWISDLERRGYPVICKRQPSTGATNPSLNCEDDAAEIRRSIDSVNGDVIVAMHSYGGVPGSTAAKGAKNVVGLVFVAAFVLPAGTSLATDAPSQEVDWREVDPDKGIVLNTRPRTTFYHDCSDSVAEKAIALLQPQNLAVMVTQSSATSWNEIPKIYALTTDDQALHVSSQETMVKNAGGWLEVKSMHTGHSPWLSQDKMFSEWFDSAVQKLMQHSRA